MSNNQPELLDHEYDGIREYDNPTPGWWHVIFLATIALVFPYIIYYHFNPDVPSREQQLVLDRNREYHKFLGSLGQIKPDDATLISLRSEEKWMGVAAGLFIANCASCHGGQGEGLVGPNLHDNHYKNVKVLGDFYRVIAEGAAGGAMPAWKNRMDSNEIILLASYVSGMRGKELPPELRAKAKAPEGDEIPAFPEAAPAPAAAPAGAPAGAKPPSLP
jgi:cytochrome c oxidase cbb3-type subunit 3